MSIEKSDPNMSPERGAAANGARSDGVLLAWSAADPGTRSAARTIGDMLAAEPHRLPVIQADLPEIVAGRAVIQSMASLVGARAEAAVAASLGWQAIEEQARERPPRVAVALDPLAASVIDTWRGKGLVRAPLVGVVSSLRLDAAWARTAVDRLSVADAEQGERALELGFPAECVVPCGVPVCGGFGGAANEDREALRRRFGLPVDRPVVLVVTHGLTPDELSGALFQLSMVAERATLLFDVARDKEGADLLRRRASLYGVQAKMFGKVEEGAQLWGASTLVIAKPHLYVEQRVIAMRLPLISLQPRPGEEQDTARIYAARRIGRTVSHLATLAAEVELQLRPAELESVRQNMAQVSRAHSSADVARLVAQVRADAEQILAEAAVRAASPPAPEEQRASTVSKGPLETIGPSAEPGAEATPGASGLEDLEAAEAEANRQVTEHQQSAEHWARRAALAAERGEDELRAEAEKLAEHHQAAMHRALADLARLTQQRQSSDRPGGGSGRVERAFRQLEIEEALAALKRRLEDGEE